MKTFKIGAFFAVFITLGMSNRVQADDPAPRLGESSDPKFSVEKMIELGKRKENFARYRDPKYIAEVEAKQRARFKEWVDAGERLREEEGKGLLQSQGQAKGVARPSSGPSRPSRPSRGTSVPKKGFVGGA